MRKSERQKIVPQEGVGADESLGFPVSRQAIGKTSANFRTVRLVFTSLDRVEVVPTWGARIFFGLFVGMGLAGVILAGTVRVTDPELESRVGPWFAGVIGSLFALLGLAGCTGLLVGRYALDRQSGLITKKVWQRGLFRGGLGVELSRVAAVQACSRHVTDSDWSYWCHELNLVLNDPPGERINLMSHGNQQRLLEDANRLAEFLHVRLLMHA